MMYGYDMMSGPWALGHVAVFVVFAALMLYPIGRILQRLGFSPFWSMLIAAIAAMILLNSMDAETLRARQAEQQKQLAAERKQRAEAAAAKQRKR